MIKLQGTIVDSNLNLNQSISKVNIYIRFKLIASAKTQ